MEDPTATIDLINNILRLGIEAKASDVHLKPDSPPFYRIDGELKSILGDQITTEQITQFVEATMPPNLVGKWEQEAQVDYNYEMDAGQRLRANCFYQRGMPTLVFRLIPAVPKSFEDLNLDPEPLEKLCGKQNGIILVCGATGSGKSTTLAAMINHINNTAAKHIVTLEDPLEYCYTDNKSIISQREIGMDTQSFASGLKGAMRGDPDIILVGEMRERETFETALQASETGHMVYSTMHASNAKQAIQRLLDLFPSSEMAARCNQISTNLRAVLTQQLLSRVDQKGRVPIMEILMVEGVARKFIEKGEFGSLGEIMKEDENIGSKTFNKDLIRLINAGVISKEAGLQASDNQHELEMRLKGINLRRGNLL